MTELSRFSPFLKALLFSLIFLATCRGLMGGSILIDKQKKEEPEKTIIEIYDEVKEMGQREGEDFIKREFHFDLDGRRENREEHVLVFSYSSKGQQILSIQITYYEDVSAEDFQGRAQEIKDINCFINDETARINECSYSQEQIKELLPQILKGIKKEKELLKLIRK